MHVKRSTLVALVGGAVVAAALIAGLVAFSVGHVAATAPRGGALIKLDGVAAVAASSRSVSVRLGADPAQRFTGTTGCAARHFVAYYGGAADQPILVTFSATEATVAYASQVYRFDEGAKQQSGGLFWQGDFGPNGAFSQIALEIGCPNP